MKSITQEEPMGCAIACAAFLLKISYKKAKSKFKHSEHSCTKGFYCQEITDVLNKEGLNYSFCKINHKNKKITDKIGSIVFVERNKNYPCGHFLVKSKNGWMNSWINFPSITPAKSGFQSYIPGKVKWIIHPKED